MTKELKTELFWLAGLFLIPMVGFAIFLALGYMASESAIPFQIYDTYYVLSYYRLLIILITKLVFVTFLIKTIRNKFYILPSNIVLLAAILFLLVIFFLVIKEFVVPIY